MDLDELNRKLQQTQRSNAQKEKNKDIQDLRRESRREGRTISSTQARLELRLREIQRNELNKAVSEAFNAAVPKAASDPNGILGKPQSVQELASPAQTPYIVTPPPAPAAQPEVAPSNTITYNAGDDTISSGESKASVLQEGQLTNAKRLYATADSGIELNDTDDPNYVKFKTKNLPPPEAPFVIDYGDTSTTAETDEWNREPEDPDVDGVQIRVFTRYTNELSAYDTFITLDGKTGNLTKTYGFFRDMLFDKHGCLVSISGETRINLPNQLTLSGP